MNPRQGGEALANQLLSPFPALKILYISGYSENALVQQELLKRQVAFVQKPFTPEQLAYRFENYSIGGVLFGALKPLTRLWGDCRQLAGCDILEAEFTNFANLLKERQKESGQIA